MPNGPFGRPSPKQSLDELVRTIDDNPDPCHVDYTPSVHRLIELGDPAIPRMLDLMLLDGEDNWLTRLHADRVLQDIINNKWKAKRGVGQHAPDTATDPNAVNAREGRFWASLGSLG
ncbi:MAG TPA: hypothetical protein VKE74_27650, partial [Gemmataceae bacterium]|nr:hypothetical protein [Gemmataceae bacterium]